MKRVNYQKLRIRNFLSIGRTPVEIEFKKGIHIITGVNKDKTDRKNGVGKSTIADAFYFAHFGETIRNIKKELIINDITNDTAEVILDVDVIDKGTQDCYRITRSLKPSKLTLLKNGVDITLDTISNTTSFIVELLGLTPSVMTNCVVMTLNDTTPFMAKGKPEKRKFIEDVFDLDMFGRMLVLLKRDYSEIKKLVEVKKAQVAEIERSVTNLKDQHQRLIVMRSERIAHYEQRKADNVAERVKLLEEIKQYVPVNNTDIENQLTKLKDAVPKINKRRGDVNDIILRNEIEIDNHKRTIEKIRAAKEAGICMECKRPYDTCGDVDIVNDVIEEELKQIAVREGSNKLNKIESEKWKAKLAAASEKISQLHDLRHNAVSKAEEQKTRTKRLESIDGWIKELDNDIASAKSSTDSFTKSIQEEAKRLSAENAIYAELLERFKILESTKFILGDEGVKTHILKKLIDMLNTRLTNYIRKLDGNCICKFNEYFEEEIINNKNKIRSYFNFSGAEKKAVDLGCLFAFSDIKRLQGGVSYNVSFYDELFDTSIDETGVSHCINILNERVEDNNECVLLISHRKEAIKAVTGDIIYLEKRNDITKRVDYDPSLS